MIILSKSLLHIIDVESERRGLDRMEMMSCIKTALEVNFRKRGRLVTVYIDNSNGLAEVTAQETILTMGNKARYREVQFIPALDPATLQACVEDYIERKQNSQQWTLALVRIVTCLDEHYLVEVLDAPGVSEVCINQMAVLPHSSVAKGDRNHPKFTTLWVVLKRRIHSKIEGGHAHAWEDSSAQFIASRNEREFLALLTYQFLSMRCDCVVHTSKGLLIFPNGADISPLFANKGQVQRQIAQLAGLERLAIVRATAAVEPDKRLIDAIKSVTQLKYGQQFKIGAANPDKLPCVYVANRDAATFVGAGGSSLYFIKTVAGIEFEWKTKFTIGSKPVSTKPMVVPRHDSRS